MLRFSFFFPLCGWWMICKNGRKTFEKLRKRKIERKKLRKKTHSAQVFSILSPLNFSFGALFIINYFIFWNYYLMFIKGRCNSCNCYNFPPFIIFEFWRFISFNVYIIFLNCNYSFMFFFVNEGQFWRSINFLIKTKVVYSKVEIIKIVVIFQCPANGVFWRARSWDFAVVLINFFVV